MRWSISAWAELLGPDIGSDRDGAATTPARELFEGAVAPAPFARVRVRLVKQREHLVQVTTTEAQRRLEDDVEEAPPGCARRLELGPLDRGERLCGPGRAQRAASVPSQLRIVTIRHGLKVFVLVLPCFGHFG